MPNFPATRFVIEGLLPAYPRYSCSGVLDVPAVRIPTHPLSAAGCPATSYLIPRLSLGNEKKVRHAYDSRACPHVNPLMTFFHKINSRHDTFYQTRLVVTFMCCDEWNPNAGKPSCAPPSFQQKFPTDLSVDNPARIWKITRSPKKSLSTVLLNSGLFRRSSPQIRNLGLPIRLT
jgi:hypothetical protein